MLAVADHLGMPATFPTLTALAAATTTIRLGSYVLNAGFYQPALLARDAGEVDRRSPARANGCSRNACSMQITGSGCPKSNSR